ncbi:MAG: DUF167 domain-containing protein [Candidatus Firestonebacteria bacterium]
MYVSVKVIPNASKNEIKEIEGKLKVYLTTSPIDGKANKSLIELLSGHFNVKRRNINIIRGVKSRNKMIEVIQ